MANLQTKIGVAQAVGFPLMKAEKLLDEAFMLLAQASAAAVEGRRTARLPLHAGHDAIEQVVTAQQTLMVARKAVHTAHYGFRDIADDMQVPARAYGDHGDTPREDGVMPSRTAGHLVSVPAANAA
ncbi:hypothetical protein [uncultured Sphingomonas sp.]|uniref:hypothetical protein n=1 Tax=uncultured Sphingomonas sp. TaxID=158754 RepID=UPI0025F07038|nr:hypothetical protein [uncultured Sphingomonas sp.]